MRIALEGCLWPSKQKKLHTPNTPHTQQMGRDYNACCYVCSTAKIYAAAVSNIWFRLI